MRSVERSAAMSERTRPISLRLAPCHIEQLKARAFTVSGTLTGAARELILTGLAGGDNKALAERVMRCAAEGTVLGRGGCVMRNTKALFLGAVLGGLGAVTLINEFAIARYPPTGRFPDGMVRGFYPSDVRSCMGARALAAIGDRTSQWHWHQCATTLAQTQALTGFDVRYWSLLLAGAFTLASALGFALTVRFDRSPARVWRGRQLLSDAAARSAFARTSKEESRLSGGGLEFLPGLTVSRERETRHWLIWGSVGAGKTQTMLHLILAALERGDGVLVLDVKGDMTAKLPGEPLLVAPQDQRSLVWNVASDCRTRQDARELAARLIAKSDDPMWSDAARDILVACVAALQATKPERWSWHDLHKTATSDADTLLNFAKMYHPDAVRLLENAESRTTQSMLSTFQAHMHVVAALGDAWRHSANGSFTVAHWLREPTPHRPLILQHDPRYPELSHAWIGGLLALLASAVGSPSLKESRERRIWIFADEFPQLPRLRHFSTFLDLGRSKGVIAVIGAQDIAQLRATYGHERADAWVGMIGTKIITQINAGRGAEEASQLVGDQEIERVERSETMIGARGSTTYTTRRDMRRVITAAEIATRLGPKRDGIRVLVLGQGADALELTVPYVSLPERRLGHVPAAWVSKAAPPEPAAPKPAQLRLIRPLAKAAAERIREMGDLAVVASISARGGVQAALRYYAHLGQDDYYLRDGEPPGRWAGEGAARLSLAGAVTKSEFEAALKGIDPKTGERLAALGGRSQDHAAGWDMTFSAPKSVSVLWALSEARDQPQIESAHRAAVATATGHVEQTAAWARRGKGGAIREPTAGLLMATFDHHTSRELDPQLHSHVFIFNLAPRRDGTWGAIVSRELYKAQKRAGAEYRSALASELECTGYAVERSADSFRVTAIPRHVERAFSKRRQAIEAAATEHGYRSPKGMELAALRTRQAKRDVHRGALFDAWRAEARDLGFEFKRDAARLDARSTMRPMATSVVDRHTAAVAIRPAIIARRDAQVAHAAGKMAGALQTMSQPAAMPGLAVDLRQREWEIDRA